MMQYNKIVLLYFFLGGATVILNTLMQRRFFSFVDIPVAKDMVAMTNTSYFGNLRNFPSLSSLVHVKDRSPLLLPIEPAAKSTMGKNTPLSAANFAKPAMLEELKPQQRTNEKQKNENIVKTSMDPSNSTSINAFSSNPKEMLVWNTETHQAIQTLGAQFDTKDKIIKVANEEGYINSNGQLVVNVDETYLFWEGGQEKLCNLLQNMTLTSSLDEITGNNVPSTVLNATMDCIDHSKNKQGFGQGNWVTAIYAARMAAYLAGVDFRFQCLDGQNSKMSLLLPWFDKYVTIAKPMNRTVWPHGGVRPTSKEACPPKYPFLRIDKMAFQIQDDLRKMAVSLVGTRDDVRRHPDVPVDATPLVHNVELDDVALHFRCGDVLGGVRRNDFGMIRFNEYKKWIPNNTESIGILTQPFDIGQNRKKDKGKVGNCRTVVHELVDYLQEFAPNAKISIRNGPNETLPLTYARLVMANHSITSLSSFGIIPVVGTFGEGYFQKGNRGVNPFATYIPDILPNVHQMEAEVRGSGEMMGKSIENLVEWFVNDTFIG
uniref:Uncharacterized protein n=1 Tax=Pseudo-nitzschia australis TaxID=44445 RepID=A0A6U9YYT3_9STRA